MKKKKESARGATLTGSRLLLLTALAAVAKGLDADSNSGTDSCPQYTLAPVGCDLFPVLVVLFFNLRLSAIVVFVFVFCCHNLYVLNRL